MKPVIVIPIFDEAATIGRVVEHARAYAPVLVVDDGSRDGGGAVAAAAGAEVLRHRRRLGKAQALLTGIATARRRGATLVVTLDGDGQHDPAAIPALLAVAGLVAALARPGRRGYAVALLVGGVLHAALLKWQPWGNRLMLYELVLAMPLAGLAVDRAFGWAPGERFAGRRVLAGVTAAVLVAGGTAGALSALYGWPRRLLGGDSVFVLDRWQSRFVVRPSWAADFTAVADAVRASGARRVGLAQGYDTWEYPWWVLLPGRDIVTLRSNTPGYPQALPTGVDAVICTLPDQGSCQQYAPAGWTLRMYGAAGYALPPGRVGAPG
jgi:glycosyltransferase involved in cell wall biosynthesis